jgi:glycogen synthase
MRLRGMKKDFSWKKSAASYMAMYEETIKKVFG